MNIENARSRTGWRTCAGIAGLVLLVSPLRLHAQVEWSTTEELARFEREGTSDLGFIRVRRLLVEPSIPVAKRDSVVDGLVQLELRSGQPRARVVAVSMLSMVAERASRDRSPAWRRAWPTSSTRATITAFGPGFSAGFSCLAIKRPR